MVRGRGRVKSPAVAPLPGGDERWANHVRWLFTKTFEDLTDRSRPQQDAYTVLGIAPLLRKLLVDSPGLIVTTKNIVAPEMKFSYAARVLVHDGTPPAPGLPPSGEADIFMGGTLDPQTDPRPTDEVATGLSLDGWLRHVVARVQGVDVSVREMIVHAATIEGGVHVVSPRREQEHHLHRLSAVIGLGPGASTPVVVGPPGASVPEMAILPAMARVTLTGIRPLYHRLAG